MSLKTLLRVLILAEALLGIGGAGLDAFFPQLLPQALQDYEANRSEEPWTVTDTSIGLIGLVGIASWFGLWFTKAWARLAYTASTVSYFVLAPFIGPSVFSAVGGILDEMSITCSGGILVLIWFSGVKEHFSPKPSVERDKYLPR